MKKYLLVIMIFMIGLTFISCNEQNQERDVFVTVYPLQYLVEELFKDTDLTVGMVPGISAHNEAIDWSPKEIIAMMNASLLIYVGANFDTYIDNQIGQIFAGKNVELVKVENNLLDFIPGIVHDHDDDHSDLSMRQLSTLGYDPHFWVSPKRMLTLAEGILELLKNKFPDESAVFDVNYETLSGNLGILDMFFEQVIGLADKHVMTSTNLYSYLAYDYGLEFIPISPGYHEETDQFTTQQKEEIVQEAIYHNIVHIIYERDSSSPLSNAVFSSLTGLGYNMTKLEFVIMDTLTKSDIDFNNDYMKIMYANLEVIRIATGQ
jgi:zinc transport system substrate-binding protein